MGRTVNPLRELRRFESSSPHQKTYGRLAEKFGCILKENLQLVKAEIQFLTSGSSSFGRASAFQAEGGGFEPRLPLLNRVKSEWFGLNSEWRSMIGQITLNSNKPM